MMLSWIVALSALQAPADAVEPQDPDRPVYSLADLKVLHEANIFSPQRSKSTSRREERRGTESKPSEPVVVKPKPLLVTGFILDPATKTPRAIIEDRNDEKHRILEKPLFAKAGDEAGGWRIEELSAENVTVVKDEIRAVLRVGESFPESTPVSPTGSAPTAPATTDAPKSVPAVETKPLDETEKNDVLERLKQKNKKKRSDEPQ